METSRRYFPLCSFRRCLFIDVGAGKFWGVRRIFARISPNLAETFLCNFCQQICSHKDYEDLFLVWPPKNVFVFFCKPWVSFFKSSNVGRHFYPDFQGFLANQNFWCCACTPCTPTSNNTAFHNSIIGNFMVYQDRLETNLLRLFVHPENSEWFSIIYVIVFEINIVDEQKQT